jgi:hypothetical protein
MYTHRVLSCRPQVVLCKEDPVSQEIRHHIAVGLDHAIQTDTRDFLLHLPDSRDGYHQGF